VKRTDEWCFAQSQIDSRSKRLDNDTATIVGCIDGIGIGVVDGGEKTA